MKTLQKIYDTFAQTYEKSRGLFDMSEFLGQELYYSHKRPDALYTDLENAGFHIESRDYRESGREIFLWVTVSQP